MFRSKQRDGSTQNVDVIYFHQFGRATSVANVVCRSHLSTAIAMPILVDGHQSTNRDLLDYNI